MTADTTAVTLGCSACRYVGNPELVDDQLQGDSNHAAERCAFHPLKKPDVAANFGEVMITARENPIRRTASMCRFASQATDKTDADGQD